MRRHRRDTEELDRALGLADQVPDQAAPYRKLALKTTGSAMHSGHQSDVDAYQAAKDVQRMVDDLRGTA